MEEIKPGQLVCSLAGRDKGKYYFVLEIVDAKHVLVVDGKRKSILTPKRKNIMHLQKYKYISNDFEEQMKSGKLTDSLISCFLKETIQKKL